MINPRFRMRTLMFAVAIVALLSAACSAMASLFTGETDGEVVLRDNFWISVSVSPLGWLVLGSAFVVVASSVVALAWAIRKG